MKTANPPIKTMTGEPWEPHVFKVGDRVKLRFSSECVCSVCGGPSHDKTRIGKVGTVGSEPRIYPLLKISACHHWVDDVGHRYQIILDSGEEGFAAAVELTPLEGE